MAQYLHTKTTAFVQWLPENLFTGFPRRGFAIAHGGGAVTFHQSRFLGCGVDPIRPGPVEKLLGNGSSTRACITCRESGC